MFGFHRRTLSLVPVKDLSKYDKLPQLDPELEAEDDSLAGRGDLPSTGWKQLAMIYLTFIAQAYESHTSLPFHTHTPSFPPSHTAKRRQDRGQRVIGWPYQKLTFGAL